MLEYIGEKYIIVVDEKNKLNVRSKNIINDNNNLIDTLISREKIIPDAISNMSSYEEVKEIAMKKELIYMEKEDSKIESDMEIYNFTYRDLKYYRNELEQLFIDLAKYINEKKQVYMLVSTEEKAKKIKEVLEKQEIFCKIEDKDSKGTIIKAKERYVNISIGKLSSGYNLYDLNQVVISADDLIDSEKAKKKAINTDFKESEKVVFADLVIGDYVVHRSYGIGIYIGVNTIKADNTIKDYIKIKYKNDDILYVPTNQMDAIRKYVGTDGIGLKLSKLRRKRLE